MRRLIVMRHGEAMPETVSDHGRQLVASGWEAARGVGELLAASGWLPAAGWVSDARRAVETRHAVAESLAGVVWSEQPGLYLAGLDKLLKLLRGAPDATQTLLIIGHNPGLSELIGTLVGEPRRLDTAEAALLAVEASSWVEAVCGIGLWTLDRMLLVP